MTSGTTTRSRLPRPAHALALAALWACGCSHLIDSHHAAKIPQYGVIDPSQPHELQMVSMPPYVVEPPDELEVSVRPLSTDLTATTLTVQADGNINLGFAGDVYVAGLTIEQVEQKVAAQLSSRASARQKYDVSVRLANSSQSKFYYVMGTVKNQGKFPAKGNETVLEAILTAELKSNSVPEKSYLVRPHPSGGPDLVLKIDWCGIRERGDTTTNYQIFPGDRVIVPGTRPPGLLNTLFGG